MNDNDGLIREVNEAVQQERLQQFLVQFGRYIGATSAAIVIATLGYVWWQTHIQSGYAKITQQFYYAVKQVEDGKAFQAREAFEAISKQGDEKLSLLAKLWLVKLKYQSGKQPEAVVMAEALLKETQSNNDFKPYHDWLSLYTPPKNDKDNIYRLTNLERLAIDAMRDGKMAEATALYREIADNNATPSTMRERATLLLSTTLKSPDSADESDQNPIPAVPTIVKDKQ